MTDHLKLYADEGEMKTLMLQQEGEFLTSSVANADKVESSLRIR